MFIALDALHGLTNNFKWQQINTKESKHYSVKSFDSTHFVSAKLGNKHLGNYTKDVLRKGVL